MPGSSDDVPTRTRGAVRPPPSLAPDDAPEVIDVPRMEPPPPSLEAMVTSGRPRFVRPQPKSPKSSLWVWLVVALATATITVYVLR